MKGLNKDRMSLVNRTLVLREFYVNERLTIQDISKSLGLSVPAISNIIRELERLEYIYNNLEIKVGKGRHQGFWELNKNKELYIGMDISPYEIKGVIVNASGKLQSDIIRITKNFTNSKDLLDATIQIINQLSSSFPVRYVGIGIHGIVDFDNGISVLMPKIRKKQEIHIVEYIEKETNLKVKIDNDCNIKALSEKWLGEGSDIDNYIWINVDYGVGASLIIHGELFRGNQYSAGQIGHIPVSGDSTPCSCGKNGCLEMLFSERAILNSFRLLWDNSEYADTLESEKITFDIFCELITQNNPIALHTLNSSGRHLGYAIALLINIISPEYIFLGGRLSKMGAPLLHILRKYIDEHSIYKPESQTMSISKLSEKEFLAGTMFLWIEDQLMSHKF